MTTLPLNLRRLRDEKNLSQSDVAERAGISRVAYRSIETGESAPRSSTLARIADRHIAIQPHHEVRATDWAPITQHAEAIHAATIEHARPTPRQGLEIDLGL